jgi:hypothetical protein
MAIQIIDNFSLNASKPIDNRFVVGTGNFYATRNDIPSDRRYIGLRIWDLNDSNPYVWNGSSWVNENTTGISGSGTTNYVSKFTTTGSIGNSQIFDNGTNVGIGTTSPSQRLSVAGNISANNFIGNGSQLTTLNINSSNVNGKIGFGNLPDGTNGFILQSSGISTQWVAQNTLSVLNSTNLNIVGNDNNSVQFIPFVQAVGNQTVRINGTNSIRINPSNGNIGIGVDPTQRLHINGVVRIQNSSSNNSVRPNGIRFDSGNSDWYSEIRSFQGADNSQIGLSFWTRPESSQTITERIRILPNGNVGIGTTNPTVRLHVSGQIRGSYSTVTASGTNMNLDQNRVVKKTAATAAQTLTTGVAGSGTTSTLIIQTGSTTGNISFGSGFKTAFSLSPAAPNTIYVIQFVSDGDNFIQSSPLVSMPV